MNSVIVLLILTVVCGAMIAVQAATNMMLLKHTGAVLWSTIVLFAVGFVYLLILAFVSRTAAPGVELLFNAPVWAYTGGVIVASYVAVIILVVPKLGVAYAILGIVSGQVLGSLLIDHYGLFSAEKRALNLERAVGIALVLLGLILAKR